VFRLDEVFADPQVRHLDLVTAVEHRVELGIAEREFHDLRRQGAIQGCV
jgi:hypothetical protein